MVIKRVLGVFVLSAWCWGITACAIGDLIDIPDIDIGGCIDECKKSNESCLSGTQGVECTVADACFDDLEMCFDASTDCTKNCTGCEAEGTCPEGEEACVDLCADLSGSCFDMIKTCIDEKEACVNESVEAKEKCFNDLIGCTAACVDEGEDKLISM